MATAQPFTWGMGGQKITTPEQAKRQREIAAALIDRPASTNWAEGLGSVTAALASNSIGDRAAQAEEEGRARAGGLFADLAVNSDPSSIIAALTSADSAWASPAQTSIASALLNSGLDRADPMYQLQRQKLEQEIAQMGQGGSTEFFGTPVPFQNADGTIGFGQLGKNGTFKPIGLPEGAQPAPTTRQVDTGTEIITMDIYGNELFRTPKDIRGAEREQAIGTAEGAGIVAAPGDIASGEMALDLLDQIENDPELPWATGQSVTYGGNTGVIPGTQGRKDFQNLVDQATSGAFLTAISEMRGLGSLSNAEGQTATAAVTRMNTATSEAAFKRALNDYRKVIQNGLDRARSKVPGASTAPAPTGSGGGGYTILGVE